MILAWFLWGSVLLRGELRKYAKKSNFENFESALYSTSVSIPLKGPVAKQSSYTIDLCWSQSSQLPWTRPKSEKSIYNDNIFADRRADLSAKFSRVSVAFYFQKETSRRHVFRQSKPLRDNVGESHPIDCVWDPGGGVLSTKVYLVTCRWNGSQNQPPGITMTPYSVQKLV